MANFKITSTTTVSELKELFRIEFGGVLRVYEGRSEASDSAKLVSIGAKEGEFECRANRTVGSFEEDFKKELNLKVKVYTKDNWVAVLDGITLASVKDIPKSATKASMEEFVGYKREANNIEDNIVKEETMEKTNKLFAETAERCPRSIILKAHSFPKSDDSFEELKNGLLEICKQYDGDYGVIVPLVLGTNEEGELRLSYLTKKGDRDWGGDPFRIDVHDSEWDYIIDEFDFEYAKKELGNPNGIKRFYYSFIEAYPSVNPFDEEERSNENLSLAEREEIIELSEVLFPSRLWHQNMDDQSFGEGSLFDDWFGDRAAVAVTDDGIVLRVWDSLK